MMEENNNTEQEKIVRKVFIRDYGNLTLEILENTELGITAYSKKRDEVLFIPWTSIIMTSNKHAENQG